MFPLRKNAAMHLLQTFFITKDVTDSQQKAMNVLDSALDSYFRTRAIKQTLMDNFLVK